MDINGNGKADYPSSSGATTAGEMACSDADGDGCDSELSMTESVLFADGVFGCTTTRDVTFECTWDADGQLRQSRRDGDWTTLRNPVGRRLHELQGERELT